MSPAEIEREVQRLVRLPYHRLISGDEAEGYLGEIVELHLSDRGGNAGRSAGQPR